MNESGTLDLGRVKAIIFDIDGTLSDSDDQMVLKVEGWLKPFGFFLPAHKSHRAARWLVMALESPGNFFYTVFDWLSLDSIFIRWLNTLTQSKKNHAKHYWIIPGVEKMLQELAARMPLAIVSARDEESSLAFVRQFRLEPVFKVIVTSQTCAHTKPFPEPLLYAAEQLKVKPEHCLMVGDTTVDIRAARLAGMQSLGVLCGFGTRHELLRAGADQIIESTAQLLDYIQAHLHSLQSKNSDSPD
jgi:HAD superfamily hydrolase (TIGR01549 family)